SISAGCASTLSCEVRVTALPRLPHDQSNSAFRRRASADELLFEYGLTGAYRDDDFDRNLNQTASPMMKEQQIDALAAHLVRGLIAKGIITPASDEKDLIACVVELMSANFEEENRIFDDAEKQAD